jgi:hypothetical protein
MRKHIGIVVAAFAIMAGTGIALAEDGDPPEVPLDEVDETTTSTTSSTVVEETTTTTLGESEAGADAGSAGDNHGAVVSQAAHDCPTGPGGVHGACVSAVARDHDQDGTPDHGPGSPGFGEHGNGGGNGND